MSFSAPSLTSGFQTHDNDFGLGHNGVRISLNYFDGIPDQNLINALPNNYLILYFKSLLKRDDKTKEKALNELISTLDTEEKAHPETVESQFGNDIFLLCWSQIYAKTVVNESKNVRVLGHLFTIKLIRLLQKRVNKFLRDFIPLILLGTCDLDPLVGKSCVENLGACFEHNEKKLSSLWSVFNGEILELIREIVVVESKDTLSDERYTSKEETEFKYNRTLSAGVGLLLNIIEREYETIRSHAESMDKLVAILQSESLWKAFNLKPPHNLKICQSIIQLIEVLYQSTKFFKENKDIFKMVVRRLFKIMAQLNQKNVISFNTLTPQIVQLLVILSGYKHGRIWSYDKNSSEKLRNFLLAAGRSTVPGYYPHMLELYKTTMTIEPVKVSLENNNTWKEVWQKSLAELNGKPFLGRHATDILVDFWENYCIYMEDQNDESKLQLQSDIISCLSSEKKLSLTQPENSKLLSIFAKHTDPLYLQREIEKLISEDIGEGSKHAVENLITLLLNCPDCGDSVDHLSAFIFEHISDNFTTIKPSIIVIISSLLGTYKQDLAETVDKIVFEMATWLEPDTFEPLSELIIKYSNSQYFNGENVSSLASLDDFFIGLCALGIPRAFIVSFLMGLQPEALSLLLKSSLEVQEFVRSYIEGYSYDDNNGASLFNSSLLDEDNIVTLYENSVLNGHLDDFCQYANILSDKLKLALFEKTEFLSQTMFKASDEMTRRIYGMLLPFMEDQNMGASIASKLVSTITGYIGKMDDISGIVSYDKDNLCLEVAAKVLDIRPQLIERFIPGDVDEYLSSNIPRIDSRISLVNELALNTFLLPTVSPSLSDLGKWLELVKYGLFIDRLLSLRPVFLENQVLLLLTVLVEVSNDYNCLSPFPDTRLSEFKNTIFGKTTARSVNLESTLEYLTEAVSGENDIVSLLLSRRHPVSTFYKSRVLFKLLQNDVDMMSRSTLIKFVPKIENIVFKAVRSRGQDRPELLLQTAILLSLLNSIITDKSFTKLRTLLASQCIGVNVSDLLREDDSTSQSLILLGNLLQLGTENVNANEFMPITPQRLNMMLNTFGKWMDSDVIYEPGFTIPRLALLHFCSLLLKLPSIQDNDSLGIFHFSSRLLMDSLDICQIDDTPDLLELRSYCLELYNARAPFTKLGEGYEEKKDIYDALVQLPLMDYSFETDNQIAISFYKHLTDILVRDVKIKTMLPYYESNIEYFVKKVQKVHCINQYRTVFTVLDLIIGEQRINAVVEYELLHQKLTDQATKEDSNTSSIDSDEEDYDILGDSAEDEFKIQRKIFTKLDEDMPIEYLQYSDCAKFILYMWTWKLALKFFDGVTYNLRQLCINQLKKNNLIERMYDFIAGQIDQIDTKDIRRILEHTQLSDYGSVARQFNTYNEELLEECKFLLPHVLYELFDNMGSLTSVWFLNIRDRSVREKFEKFVSRYISPVLITTELDNVASKIKRLTEKDSALTIKVNRVSNEIKAGYLIDEQKLEISFKLPNNYPLSNVQVIGVSRVGITEQKWKQWIMSTQHVITGMNGTVLDSLELFTRNVNLQFSGFEECAICYSILHAVDRKLPTKVCPTCHNNFHGACLYKWFRSSGNNTCPLCRSEIPFRRKM